MSDGNTIAIDLMGSDLGAGELVLGAARFIQYNPGVNLLLYGDEKVCLPILNSHRELDNNSIFYHCDFSIAMDEKPADALRKGRNVSSMWRAIESVKKNEATAIVTAGNTGALIAMSRLCLSKISGVDRPSLAAFWPTIKGKSIILDVGANIGAITVPHMIQMSIVGSVLARFILGVDRPSIGLLNVGTEEIKGNDVLQEAGRLLREESFGIFEYKGFIEASDITNGLVDVVVTEGFSGNIAIKTAEGVAKRVVEVFKESLSKSFLSRIGGLLIKGALQDVKEGVDPRKFNGGVLLGVDGLVIKGHGSSDFKSICNVLDIALNMSQNNFISAVKADMQKIRDNLSDMGEKYVILNGKR
ncbi:MAG: phosphate acyltransferase PlsX [Candidatus Liberibacter europaeus]|uniref:Phosphate acyltransferase n=1 Tax=Candidatus Liberibacter europaeus TaxID=744859 RepID=A0A2T4VY07_9HYPH|nr:phosphate acyltransferase PlsX [Candidatus Liberibacter europaeus]PTL86654.1 MAG: phosphate acyltransferase PlsX [Candidatus Liberibacter europaeus]